jgi:enterochelin esterase-like enzyme
MVEAYRDNLLQLRALGIDVGTHEDVQDEVPDTRALHGALIAAGIPHRFEVYEGSREGTKVQRMASTVLPFLAGALDGGASATGP